MLRRTFLALAASLTLSPAWAIDVSDWDAVKKEARGQTVYFNAWGGADNINAFIDWAAGRLAQEYGVTLKHVKLEDTASAVSTVLAEKTAGRDMEGSIDLIWINGENFAAMKRGSLLFAPGWAETLPNWSLVDWENKPTIRTDFTVPVEGLESPWGGAKLVFFHDSANTKREALPDSFSELVEWTKSNPGRFSYPAPPDFIGSSFLKQALVESVEDPTILSKEADDATFERAAAPLFAALDAMTPNLWRGGRAYPRNYPAMTQLLADNAVDIAFAFNPADASAAIADGRLPDTVRSFTFSGGTLGNTHFVAIPYNASAKAGALVAANFLLSPEAQARKQDPNVWGDPTVLAMGKLEPEDKARFDALELGIATLAPADLGPLLSEPHPSWTERLEREWLRRYGVGQ